MKKILLFVLSLLALAQLNFAQNFEWANGMGSASYEEGRSIAVDAQGNVFTTGIFQGTVDFDPSVGVFPLTSAGFVDVFVTKVDASGNLVWALGIGGSQYEEAFGIALDDSSNIFITGSYIGTFDFDPGVDTTFLNFAGGNDVFVCKLDSSGNLVWASSIGGPGGEEGTSVAVDDAGNVYSTGSFNGTTDFDPGIGTFNLTAGTQSIYVSKLDVSGNFVWAKKMGGTLADIGKSIALDPSGNVITTGYFYGDVDFDPGTGISYLTAVGDWNAFVSKLDAAGNFLWAKVLGNAFDSRGFGVKTDASGNIFATGYFIGTSDFDPNAGTSNLTSAGMQDIYVAKLDENGNLIWAKSMGGAGNDQGNSIALDGTANVFVTGYFNGSADFDPSGAVHTMTSGGLEDIFITKLDNNGNFSWATGFGGTVDDIGTSIAVDALQNIYGTGHFYGTVDFDPGAGVSNLYSNSVSADIYVLKLSATVVSIDESGAGASIVVYPNPASTSIAVKSEEPITSISIFNLVGELVQYETTSSFDVEHLSAGLYFLQISTETGIKTARLIKE